MHQQLYVENLSHATMNWLLLEITFDKIKNKFFRIANRVHPSYGKISSYGERVYLNYEIYTKEPVIWSSVLLLLTDFNGKVYVNDICFFNYKVVFPNVKITADKSNFPILFCDEILHKHIPTLHKVYIRNVGYIKATYVWGSPIGAQCNMLNLRFSPQTATLNPGNCMNVTVEITPLELGILENICVPCFIDNLEKPIMLKILCLVDDIYFYVSLPNDEDIYENVYWPPPMINDYDGHEFYYTNDDFNEVIY